MNSKIGNYNKQQLKDQLESMGLKGDETILIHSSMKAIGAVDGGADTVLDAWMEYFKDGLLLLPTHTWKTVYEKRRGYTFASSYPQHVWLRKKCRRISGR